MNLYQVISEPLVDYDGVWADPPEPPEEYAIAELVAAETPGQAKWTAWKTDKGFCFDIREMPKFEVRKVRSGLALPRGLYTRDFCWCGADIDLGYTDIYGPICTLHGAQADNGGER